MHELRPVRRGEEGVLEEPEDAPIRKWVGTLIVGAGHRLATVEEGGQLIGGRGRRAHRVGQVAERLARGHPHEAVLAGKVERELHRIIRRFAACGFGVGVCGTVDPVAGVGQATIRRAQDGLGERVERSGCAEPFSTDVGGRLGCGRVGGRPDRKGNSISAAPGWAPQAVSSRAADTARVARCRVFVRVFISSPSSTSSLRCGGGGRVEPWWSAATGQIVTIVTNALITHLRRCLWRRTSPPDSIVHRRAQCDLKAMRRTPAPAGLVRRWCRRA